VVVKQYDDILAERYTAPPKLLTKEEEDLIELAKQRLY